MSLISKEPFACYLSDTNYLPFCPDNRPELQSLKLMDIGENSPPCSPFIFPKSGKRQHSERLQFDMDSIISQGQQFGLSDSIYNERNIIEYKENGEDEKHSNNSKEELDPKRRKQLTRNRLSAKKSRMRKKEYVRSLETQVKL